MYQVNTIRITLLYIKYPPTYSFENSWGNKKNILNIFSTETLNNQQIKRNSLNTTTPNNLIILNIIFS